MIEDIDKRILLVLIGGILALVGYNLFRDRRPKDKSVERYSNSRPRYGEGSPLKTALSAIVMLSLAGCFASQIYVNMNTGRMMTSWRAKQTADLAAQQGANGGLQKIELSTNIFLEPGQRSAPVHIFGHQIWRLGPVELRNEQVLVEHIFLHKVGFSTNGPIYQPVRTNIVPFWSTNSYSQGTEIQVRFTSKHQNPIRIDLTAGR